MHAARYMTFLSSLHKALTLGIMGIFPMVQYLWEGCRSQGAATVHVSASAQSAPSFMTLRTLYSCRHLPAVRHPERKAGC